MRRTERRVYSYELKVEKRAKLAPYARLEDIVGAWTSLHGASDTVYERERGDVAYRIGDISIDAAARVVKLLIRRGDIHASNPFFHDRATGNTRAVVRSSTEDGERAAHLVISLDAETDLPNTYLCHLEGVSGISHRHVQAMLNALISRAKHADLANFDYPDPSGARHRDGRPRMLSSMPRVSLEGVPSATILNDLENGVLQGMTLVDRRPRNLVGGNQYLVEKEKYLVVTAAPNMPSSGRFQAVLAAARSQRANFQSMRLRFVDPAGQPRTVGYDIASGTPEQQLYVQSYLVANINPPMDDSSLSLVPFLTHEMVQRVVADRT
jgi:hypothetical protein